MGRSREAAGAAGARGGTHRADVPFEVDALRGDLYRLLDLLARSGPERRASLIEAFERLWTRFKEASARPQ